MDNAQDWLRLAQIGWDAQQVIALRLMKLARGGVPAAVELNLMVAEKMLEASKAAVTLASGGTIGAVLGSYHTEIQRNKARLSRRRSPARA